MKHARAFTLAELLISLGIVFFVGWIFLMPANTPRRPQAQRIKCVNNLKTLGLAVSLYREDNGGTSVSGALTNWTTVTAAYYLRIFSNELSTPKILICPSDNRSIEATNWATLSNRNVSYFANLLARNASGPFLSGDRNVQTNGVPLASGAKVQLGLNLDMGWTQEMHRDEGHILLADGSVQAVSSARLREMSAAKTTLTNLLLIP